MRQIGILLKEALGGGLCIGLAATLIATLAAAKGIVKAQEWTDGAYLAFAAKIFLTYAAIGFFASALSKPASGALSRKLGRLRLDPVLRPAFACLAVFGIWLLDSEKTVGSLSFLTLMAAATFAVLHFLCREMKPEKLGVAVILTGIAAIIASSYASEWMSASADNFPQCNEQKNPKNENIRKIVVFGFDGVSYQTLKRAIDAGATPNIKKIVESGISGSLTSFPYRGRLMSPVVWTTIFTGQKPDDHGIEDYTTIAYNGLLTGFHTSPYTSNMRKKPALWNIVGGKAVVSGLWATWPPEEIDGVMISDGFAYAKTGWHINEKITAGTVYPPGMEEEIRDYVNGYDGGGSTMGRVGSDDLNYASPDVRWETARALDDTYYLAAKYAANKTDPDFTFIYFEGSDIVQHFFCDDPVDGVCAGKKVVEYLGHLDELVGETMAENPDGTTYIIVSDHGLMPIKERTREQKLLGIYADHSLEGVFVAAGPDFLKNQTFHAMDAIDFTPTILYYMGAAVSKDMDGRVQTKLFTEGYVSGNTCEKTERTMKHRADRGEFQGKDEMIEKLKSLGYI